MTPIQFQVLEHFVTVDVSVGCCGDTALEVALSPVK